MPVPRNDLRQICTEFYAIQGFPGVCGSIDCTQVRIQSPGGQMEKSFEIKKGGSL